MRTISIHGRIEQKNFDLTVLLAKVLTLEDKGLHEEAKRITQDLPIVDYLESLSSDERDRFLFSHDSGIGQLNLL